MFIGVIYWPINQILDYSCLPCSGLVNDPNMVNEQGFTSTLVVFIVNFTAQSARFHIGLCHICGGLVMSPNLVKQPGLKLVLVVCVIDL